MAASASGSHAPGGAQRIHDGGKRTKALQSGDGNSQSYGCSFVVSKVYPRMTPLERCVWVWTTCDRFGPLHLSHFLYATAGFMQSFSNQRMKQLEAIKKLLSSEPLLG